MTDRLARFRLTIWHVVLALPFFAVGIAARRPIRDNSFLWHVTAGRLQIENGSVLTTDPFSFTRFGEPWRTQSWLADLGYAVLEGRWGLGYVSWMVWAVASLFMLAALLIAFRASGGLAATGTFGVLTIVLSVAFLNPRPAIFSFLLFALLVLADGDRRLRWASPLLLWLWAAAHGSFVIGLAYLALQAVRRRRRGAWREIVAGSLAVSLTAHGIGVWEILLEFAGNREALDTISEWATPDLISVPFLPLFVAVVVLIWAAMRGSLGPRDLIVVVPFLALAFTANRSVPPAWIALAPFVARGLSDLRVPDRQPTRRLAAVNALIVLALVVTPLLFSRAEEFEQGRFPVELADALESQRVFHDDATGGYLIYAQWPVRQVYVDDRAELYGNMLAEFARVHGGYAGWQEVFERYKIDEALLRHTAPLAETLRLAGWQTVAESPWFILQRPPQPGSRKADSSEGEGPLGGPPPSVNDRS
jgi:hypothetical protein